MLLQRATTTSTPTTLPTYQETTAETTEQQLHICIRNVRLHSIFWCWVTFSVIVAFIIISFYFYFLSLYHFRISLFWLLARTLCCVCVRCKLVFQSNKSHSLPHSSRKSSLLLQFIWNVWLEFPQATDIARAMLRIFIENVMENCVWCVRQVRGANAWTWGDVEMLECSSCTARCIWVVEVYCVLCCEWVCLFLLFFRFTFFLLLPHNESASTKLGPAEGETNVITCTMHWACRKMDMRLFTSHWIDVCSPRSLVRFLWLV